MPWFKAGTVSVVQNSNAVIGAGTAFIANARVGDAFRGPDGGWYEVTNIVSDTALSIAPPYLGATNATGAYALAPMQGYVKDSADALRALVNQFGGVMAVLGQTATQAGVRASLNLTNTDGLPEGPTNKYMTASGVRTTPLTGLDLAISAPVVATDSILVASGKLQAQVSSAAASAAAAASMGVGRGYIDGLLPAYTSGTGISVTSGTAYIPGLGKNIYVPNSLTLSGLSLSGNTWYYLYLYDNAGTPAIELVTTAPSAPYSGNARTKTGDTSRRFICALRTSGATGLYNFIVNQGFIEYRENIPAAPFRVLAAGAATTPTGVNCSTVVPPVTQTAIFMFSNIGTPVMFVQFPGLTSAVLQQVAAGTRFKSQAPLSTAQFVDYSNSGTGGNSYIDVCGYGMER
ncbi:hypothetical protein WCL09_17665 [Pseudomonas koreensis]|uniref:hypothetical protein n=1 Tax=Pseudomonas koreensis TaxID=198620 RepID=UPI00301770B4